MLRSLSWLFNKDDIVKLVKSQFSDTPFMYKQELLNQKEKANIPNDEFLDVLYENESVLANFQKETTKDMLLTDIVLCTYYHKDDAFSEVVKGLLHDFERTIYSRVDSDSFNVMCKRVFYQQNNIKYSIYGNSKAKFNVM